MTGSEKFFLSLVRIDRGWLLNRRLCLGRSASRFVVIQQIRERLPRILSDPVILKVCRWDQHVIKRHILD